MPVAACSRAAGRSGTSPMRMRSATPERAALVRRRQHTRADRLREPERVACAQPVLAQDALRVHAARHREAELGLAVDDRVPTGDDAAGLTYGVDRAGEDSFELRERRVLGPRRDLERE